MENNSHRVKQFLVALGLDSDQAAIYLALIKHGTLTALELSRHTQLPRTKVYRRVEVLKSTHLIEEIIDQNTTRYAAVSPEILEQLIKAKRSEMERLTRTFPHIEHYLNQQISKRQPDTQVKFYKNKTGIQQMVYNVLNAQTGIVGYTYRDLEAITGHNFAQNIYAELIENKITVRDIFSDSYIESVGSKKAAVHSLDRVPNWKKFVTSRYIPKITLDITHQLDIYNDVVAIYNWHEGEVFGVEIHNPKVATFQRQLFELVWNLAIPEDKLLKEDLITP